MTRFPEQEYFQQYNRPGQLAIADLRIWLAFMCSFPKRSGPVFHVDFAQVPCLVGVKGEFRCGRIDWQVETVFWSRDMGLSENALSSFFDGSHGMLHTEPPPPHVQPGGMSRCIE